MARTKASVGAKISSGKSSKARCSVAAPSASAGSSGSSKSTRDYSGGNSVCPRETPNWQRPITNFFVCKDKKPDSNEEKDETPAGSSKTKPKRNVIQSDDEEDVDASKPQSSDVTEEKPTNYELDEILELEPLNGENSHKMEDYYSKSAKGKGKGKKTKDKENIDSNRRRSSKRDLEEESEEETEHSNKRVRVN